MGLLCLHGCLHCDHLLLELLQCGECRRVAARLLLLSQIGKRCRYIGEALLHLTIRCLHSVTTITMRCRFILDFQSIALGLIEVRL